MASATAYESFLYGKSQLARMDGFEPTFMPSFLFDFQAHLVEWAVRRGRAALFEDCGLGKTIQELTVAENIVRHTNGRVLILTPIAVAQQFISEGEKFGIECRRSTDGKLGGPGIYIANYERLHYFDHKDFTGIICDESSILKSFSGKTQKAVTRFMAKAPYRLLGTATAAPNDYVELGTSSEALGELSHSEMLKRFFAQLDDKGQKRERRLQDEAEKIIAHDPSYYKKLAFRVSQTIGQWRLRHHAITHFWRWVASWAIAIRKPSDIGFDDAKFNLPPLIENDHVITPKSPPPGRLFVVPALGMHEEREERKRTLAERCEHAAKLVDHDQPAVVWCHTNAEGDRLTQIIPDAEQIAGKTPDDRKEELYAAFASGELRALVIKPKIGAWGLNWQHCNHVVTFASHSYEQYYQSVRRCWRFGQKRPVRLDVIATDGEVRVLENMRSKARKADEMFAKLVAEMNMATRVERENIYVNQMELPRWL